jgi:transposase
MQPYSKDLRSRIVAAHAAGEGSVRELARRFAVSPFFVQKLLTKFRATGSLAPKPYIRYGPVGKRTPEALEYIRQLVIEYNDATLAELCERLAQRHDVQLSVPSMCRALKQLDLPRKKDFTRHRAGQ